MKIAVAFNNFGPYHVARLKAAAARCNLLAVEIFANSSEYPWHPVDAITFQHATLMQEASTGLTSRDISRRVAPLLSAFQPDVIAIPGWYGLDGVELLRYALNSSVPVVLMSDSQERDFHRLAHKEWVKCRYVRHCSSALVGGRTHAEYLVKLGMDRRQIRTGYDVVDNAFFAKGSESAKRNATALRKAHGLPQCFFLASARFIAKKNLDRLLHAYARYREVACSSGADTDVLWQLVLLGDGELRPSLEATIAELSLDGFVHLPGFKQIKELPEFYGLAECFILPSTTEQWGLVVNEAMASRLPVIVSERCGCAAELVAEGRNGFTFDPFDTDALADRMLRMADPATDRGAMGQASREIIARWTPETFARGLVDAAEAALQAPPRRMNLLDRAVLKALTWR